MCVDNVKLLRGGVMKRKRIVLAEIFFVIITIVWFLTAIELFNHLAYGMPYVEPYKLFLVPLRVVVLILYLLTTFSFGVYNLGYEKFGIRKIITAGIINIVFTLIGSTLFFKRIATIEIYSSLFVIQMLYYALVRKSCYSELNVLIIGGYKGELFFEIGNKKVAFKIVKHIELRDTQEMDDFKKDPISYMKKYELNYVVLRDYSLFSRLKTELVALKLEGFIIETYRNFFEFTSDKVLLEEIDEEWFLYSNSFPSLSNRFYRRIKRICDIIFALILIIPCAIIVLIFALLIKLETPGPAFFIQSRMGYRFKPFNMIKLRTMRMHNPDEHSKYSSKNDSRITRLGKFMRKTRIDELPQLINVLKGEMTFVGPRSEWVELHKQYEGTINEFYHLRYLVKPGLTGWAQVNFTYSATLEDVKKKFAYDLYYVRYGSLVLDIIIFLKTFETVFKFRGQ